MQTIDYAGLHIEPDAETEGYDIQKDLIERGSRKIRSTYRKNDAARQVIRAVPTQEKGSLFTVFVNGDTLEFGLYSGGIVRQTIICGHPPITERHLDRLCDRVEGDLQGRLKYVDDPAIEKAWGVCLEQKSAAEFADAVRSLPQENQLKK